MSDAVIKVENLAKAYRIGLKEQKNDTLGGAIVSWLKSPAKNYRKLRNLSSFDSYETDEDIFWALKDVSFEVDRGDIMGVVGRNGAGKSTLLKILSKITDPTKGEINIKGRVASLLEVGTGFNPELTGRENTYLNGTILGMRRKEIDSKFDEIVEFSGVEKFIDTPVKRYSSGMKVRLGFAVAAHLEPEILIVDEVLAVGDAEFQKKCLGKMRDVSVNEGRTVLFVSHNMGAVAGLCNRCILLKSGVVSLIGDTKTVIGRYLSLDESRESRWQNDGLKVHSPYYNLLSMVMVDEGLNEQSIFSNDKAIGVLIEGFIETLHPSFILGFAIYNSDDVMVFWTTFKDKKVEDWLSMTKDKNTIVAWIPEHFLNEGEYRVECMAAIHFREWILQPEKNSPTVYFAIKGGLSESPDWLEKRRGVAAPILNYTRL